ncbi:unnamed protein product, partial [Effrenium voratum]
RAEGGGGHFRGGAAELPGEPGRRGARSLWSLWLWPGHALVHPDLCQQPRLFAPR